jgi:hypothetical protein
MENQEHENLPPAGSKPLRRLPSAPRVGVDVTRTIIARSTQRDSSHCMISDAIQEAIPDARFISVDIQTIRYTLKGMRYTYLTPRKAQIELIRFDQGADDIEPFSFQLRTGQTTRSGSRRAVKAGVSQPRTPAQDAATEKAMAQSTKGFRAGKVTLVRGSSQGDYVPEIRGGRVPPMAPLAGGPGTHGAVPAARRRAFGLRAMDRLK